ncbi:MAG: NAD(P)H-hydrate dehydratase [Acidimicrobiales bacterium]
MILGIGNDLVDLDRFRRVLERRPALLQRLFTAGEIDYAQRRSDPTERFAVRFAAKEAVLKAMGVGIGAVGWHEIEVLRHPDGQPSIALTGRAARLATELGIEGWRLTLSHSDLVAQAIVVAMGATTFSAARRPAGTFALPHINEIDGGGLVPIVTPAEMNEIDRTAPEPVEVLIDRAGREVARVALRMLGGTYGRRVVVLVGKGNNGNDGRVAAAQLRSRGVRVQLVDASAIDADDAPEVLPECDLVIDAAYGTGFRGGWNAPIASPGSLVLAVDIPSGIDGLTGSKAGAVLAADVTISFAALKPGNIFAEGLEASGDLLIGDVGLDTRSARTHLVGAAVVSSWIPEPPRDAHKWQTALWVVAGSPGMGGAAALCSGAAARVGAGYIRVSTPGGVLAEVSSEFSIETVHTELPLSSWSSDVIADLHRFGALVIGNGIGVSANNAEQMRRVVAAATGRGLPTVVDADGLTALGTDAARFVSVTTVLTPHDGEFARLAGHAPGNDRIEAARNLAEQTGAIVLLKGRSTVVAAPDGQVLVSVAGDQRLATAGTGDVLAGIIGALMACGVEPFHAAAAGAFLHGRAGALGWHRGLVAGDVIAHLPAVLDELTFLRP